MELRQVNGFKGYLVDLEGNLYSSWTTGKNSHVGTKIKKLKPYKIKNGYLFHSIRIDNCTYINTGIHRLVCLAFHGLPPSNEYVASHFNGIRDDNRPENLLWETQEDNLKRKVKHGNYDGGYLNSRAKITKEILQEIRNLLSSGKYTHEVIGKRFGLNRVFITKIKNGHRYAKV